MKASPASSLPKGIGGLNFVSHHYSSSCSSNFSCLLNLEKFFNLLFTYLDPKAFSTCSLLTWIPRCLLPRALLALPSLKMKRGLISFLASTSRKGEREPDLFYGLNIARRRGGLICLSVLYCVSTLEERPAKREVVSSSACLNTWDKSRTLVPTPVKRPITAAPYRPRGV